VPPGGGEGDVLFGFAMSKPYDQYDYYDHTANKAGAQRVVIEFEAVDRLSGKG
jgi:hypothetical protein